MAPRAGCGGSTRAHGRQAGAIRLATLPGGAELAGELVVAGAVVWISDPGPGVVRLVDQQHPAARPGRPPYVASPNLHELQTDRITAVAAADDGGLWLGTAQGLFHLDQRVLARDSTAHGVR